MIGAVASLNLAGVLELLGRDATLTGRTELWDLLLAAVGERPWLGYGYGAFWETTATSRAIWESIQWNPGSAHNGYVELLLGLGVVGPIVIMCSVLVSLKTAVVALIKGRFLEAKWSILVTLALLVQDFNESTILQQNEILWVFYLTGAIYAHRAAQDARTEAGFSRKPVLSPVRNIVGADR
jgi:exopolysaccharide production protein ExoQ